MSQHQEENEAIAHRFNMDIFQDGKLEVADEIIASDFVWRNPILQCGPKKYKEIVSAVIDGMPDPQITDYDTIAKSDKVMIRWTMTGTPKRTFWHISKR